jgi:large subunit ribosomal protein L22
MGKPSRKKDNHAPNRVSAMTVRLAPRKARVVVDMVRGLYVDEALRALRFTPRKGARVVEKLIESALSGMEAAGKWDIDDVRVTAGWVNEGPTLRRFMPRAQGRATRIRKRTSHIHLVLDADAVTSSAAEDLATEDA